jgi:hypothetical protein
MQMQRGKKTPQKQGHISPTKYKEKNITRIDGGHNVITLHHSLKNMNQSPSS